LSPSSIEMVLNDLHDCPFSVGTDASNKGNIKCWPLLLSYFSRTEGCKTGPIDFYGDVKKTFFFSFVLLFA
jgi:hypothetical protein